MLISWVLVNTALSAFGWTKWGGVGNWWEVTCEIEVPVKPKVRMVGYTGAGTCDPSLTYTNFVASGMKETINAEDTWTSGNHTLPSSLGNFGQTVWLLGDGGSVWATFSQPSTDVVIQFASSDSNDGPADVYVDGILMVDGVDTWNQGNWYIEVYDLPDVVHTVKVVDVDGASTCAAVDAGVQIDWFGRKTGL